MKEKKVLAFPSPTKYSDLKENVVISKGILEKENNAKIIMIHVKVCKDQNKIEKLCRIAMVQKGFEFLGWVKADNEKELQKVLKEHLSHNLVYFLTINKQKKEVDCRRLPKPKREMKEWEKELTYKEALTWLKSIK